jgi:hypothetical protein
MEEEEDGVTLRALGLPSMLGEGQAIVDGELGGGVGKVKV